MTIAPSQQSGITLPITTEFKRIAQRFAEQCPFVEKAEQIRHNTLAVCAVNAYLQLMDVPTAIGQGDSWNPMMQMMADVADLQLPGVGTLSCRPVKPGAIACYIPPEDWHDRAGYIAVAIDENEHKATLIGFAKTADEMQQVPLTRFEPLESLIDEVAHLRCIATEASTQNGISAALTQLSQWVEGAIATTWQAADSLINPTEMNFAFRTTAELAAPEVTSDISRAKLVDLGIQLGQSVQVALVVHVTQLQGEPRSDILLQLRPLGDSPYLPEGLVLSILDEKDATFRSATAREIDNYIQLRFSGETGELFGVGVSIGETTFKEQFVI